MDTRKDFETIEKELIKRREEHASGGGSRRTRRRIIRLAVALLALGFFALGGMFLINFLRLNSDLIEGHIKQKVIPNLSGGAFPLAVGKVTGDLIHGVELQNLLVVNPHFPQAGIFLNVPRVVLTYSLLDAIWGSLVLERVVVENPVLTLARGPDGRGIWNFASGTVPIEKPVRPMGSSEDPEARAEVVADRYLRHIEINNLSIMSPRPRDLMPDQTVARMLRLPPGNLALSGIDIKVEKTPHRDYSHHMLRVNSKKSGNIAMLQWDRQRTTGNFNVTIDAWKKRLILDVKNAGAAGRRIQVYDEHDKDRLMLGFGLARQAGSLFRRMIGPKGHLKIADLAAFSEIIPLKNTLAGSLQIALNSAGDDTPLVESDFEVKVADVTIGFGDLVPIKKFALDLTMKNRLADVRHAILNYGALEGIHSGTIDLTNFPAVQASFSSVVNQEPLNLFTSVGAREAGNRHVSLRAARPAGFLEVDVDQETVLGMQHYRRLQVRGGINPGKRISDLVPARLFPPQIAARWDAWISRVDLIGPLDLTADVPSPENAALATLSLVLRDAVIVNRQNPEYRANLTGRLLLGERSLTLENLGARIDDFRVGVEGRLKIDETLKKLESYDLGLDCTLTGDKPFQITGKRFQETLGLTHTPTFKSLVVEGKELARVRLTSREEPQSVQVNVPVIRLLLGKKIIWVKDLTAGIFTSTRLDTCGFKPPDLDVTGACSVFGFPMKARARVNVASQTFDQIAITGTGDSFGKVLEAMREHPDFGPMLQKYPLSLDGKFALEVTGNGRLQRPSLFGNLRFPFLGVKVLGFAGKLPFDLGISSTREGNYEGKIKTQNAQFNVKGVDFSVQSLEGDVTFGRPDRKAKDVLGIDLRSVIFGTEVNGAVRFVPLSETLERGSFRLASRDIAPLVKEIGRFAGFKLPFSLTGPFKGEWKSSGRLKNLRSSVESEVENLQLTLPLGTLTGKPESLVVSGIKGKVQVAQDAEGAFAGAITGGRATILGAPLALDGKVRLDKQPNGYAPFLDGVKASLTGLPVKTLHDFLRRGFALPALLDQFSDMAGQVSGTLSLSGGRNRFVGTGDVALTGGAVRYAGLPERIENISGSMVFSRNKAEGEPEIEIRGLTSSCGRARFAIPGGKLIGPGKSGRLTLEGIVENLFPSEVLKLLAQYQVPKLSFPKEGPWSGKVSVTGTVAAPAIKIEVEGGETDVVYHSGAGDYTVPIGENSVAFSYDVKSGAFALAKGILRFLRGEANLTKARARFATGGLRDFELEGKISGIDLGSLGTPGKSMVKGTFVGTIQASAKEKGLREALGQLRFQDLVITKIPLDQAAIDKIGLDFLEEPEFTTGELNLYVSSEGDTFEKGRVRVADGLFAGPNIRLEIEESFFDPKNLQLAAKLVFNPQPLRRTKLGRKLGSLTRVLQERERGLPYVDLTVAGTWDKPEMMSKYILNRNKGRGKRNFIKSIFGGRSSHKATVEELKEWFPGWEPGQ